MGKLLLANERQNEISFLRKIMQACSSSFGVLFMYFCEKKGVGHPGKF